ncbi:MAG: peptidoglycan-associated lipoprotein [Bacteroidetes bacterium]|nr:MAG: peptidoglycan-associated lipoprotein [Bacteroidota bacterium]
MPKNISKHLVMSKKIYITLLFGLFIVFGTFAQKNVEFSKENFPNQKPELKNAIREIETGDEYFAEGNKHGYKNALTHYLIAQDFNPNNALLNFKIGVCFLKGSNYKTKSLEFFQKAYSLNHQVDKDIHLYLGMAYQLNEEWDKAINEYKKHKQTIPATEGLEKIAEADKKIKECETGKELTANPIRVFIDNLGPNINTKYPEYGAIITADESVMMFTSRRDNTTGGKIDPFLGEFYEDVYISKKVNGKWSPAENMGKPVNTDGHDAIIGLSPDGFRLLIYLDDNGDGNIYECFLKGDHWSRPHKLGKNINTDYHESSACFSPDERYLYFVSDKPEGGFGGHDIYVSEWNDVKQKWGPPKNLGPNINTPYDEEAVFIHPDGKTMYFSSKGHNTMGGYDIFVSELKNGIWQKPVNIGYPVNSPDDDVFLVVSADGKRGYYSSFKPNEGYGEKDIYLITFLGPEKQVIMNTEDNLIASIARPVKEKVIEPEIEVPEKNITILKGKIFDEQTGQPIEAQIEVIDNEAAKVIARFSSNSASGKYLVTLPAGKNYGITVKHPDYLFHSENFIIPQSAAYKEVVKDIGLKKMEVGKTIVLNNIFFDFDKATLRPESEAEIQNVYTILKENPKLSIEIGGHTDSKGSDEYNQKLSEARAKAVVDRLIEMGISPDRLSYKGYGETQPIASNDTDEGRQLNRRTEFKIIGVK